MTSCVKATFPKELPDAFHTTSYADAMAAGVPAAVNSLRRISRYVRHHLARPGLLHRTLGLPHPVQFQRLCAAVITGWPDVSSAFNSSQLSLTTPKDDPAGMRACVQDPDQDLLTHRIRLRASSRFVVKADVSQWYPSTYTHSIPWALHGKAIAKAKRKRSDLIGNRIDGRDQERPSTDKPSAFQ